jgi:hypothetical protein
MATRNPFGTNPFRPGERVNPPRHRTPPIFSRGPRDLTRRVRQVGPGNPPANFVGGTTSAEEWYVYWAMAKVFGSPRDPRKPPFFGAEDGSWDYQSPILGTYTRSPGSAVIDFVAHLQAEDVAIRLQTERFHVFAGPEQNRFDRESLIAISKFMRVEDVFSQDLIADPTGEAAVVAVKNALAGSSRADPSLTGLARRVRASRSTST